MSKHNKNKNKIQVLSWLAVLVAGQALANPEAPGMYDARVHGMGGAAVAYLDSPAAAIHNPANLAATVNKQHQFDITALLVQLEGSFAGPENVQSSPWIFAPLPFTGYQKRLTDDITGGYALYMAVGFGGGYDDVKQYGTGRQCTRQLSDVFIVDEGSVVLNPAAQMNDYCPPYGRSEEVNLALFELAFPFSYEVTDKLRVGLSLRLPFGMFTQKTSEDIVGAFVPPEQAAGSYGLGYTQVESTMYGTGKPGFLFGITYDVTDYFTVAATYRSKVTTVMKGDTSLYLESNILTQPAMDMLGGLTIGEYANLINSIPMLGPLLNASSNSSLEDFARGIAEDIDSEISWSTAKHIELGFALQVTPKILFAADWKHQFLADANKAFIVELKEPIFEATGLNQLGQQLNWKDVYSWSFGLEYALAENQQLRFGYSVGNSATPEAYHNAFTPPPADKQDSYYIGYGIKVGKWQYDTGFSYGYVEYEIDQPYDADGNPVDPPNCRPGQLVKSGCPGKSSVTAIFISLAANYILP
jgi:long-subunit fatty acid transport protein